MFLKHFYTQHNDRLVISAQQASDFAKTVAGDFNPIHCPTNKRFCVPGDLLFSIILAKYGISPRMHFNFLGMLGDSTPLNFPQTEADTLQITDDKEKVYLELSRQGTPTHAEQLISNFIRRYVEFSGYNFPHILVPLVQKHNVMIHPTRPLVVYDSMSFELDHLDFEQVELRQTQELLEINGKRGDVTLNFDIYSEQQKVGHGFKKLILSGLMPYEQDKIQIVIDDYEARKNAYQPLAITF